MVLLELGQEHIQGLGALTEVADGDAAALEGLLDVAGGIQLAETGPLSEVGALLNSDDVNVVLAAETLDELLVAEILAVLGEDAQVDAAAVKGAGDLRETTDETVDLQGLAEHDAEGFLHRSGLFFLNDLGGDGDLGGGNSLGSVSHNSDQRLS